VRKLSMQPQWLRFCSGTRPVLCMEHSAESVR
jgi:hypothetical protein